jgi:hypothetical protein
LAACGASIGVRLSPFVERRLDKALRQEWRAISRPCEGSQRLHAQYARAPRLAVSRPRERRDAGSRSGGSSRDGPSDSDDPGGAGEHERDLELFRGARP